MNKQLYVKLEPGERIKEGDLVWVDESQWKEVGSEWIGTRLEEETAVIRPVSIERVTGTESAFPSFDGSGAVGGMTLREHYAGLAMQGLCSAIRPDDCFSPSLLAETSVGCADALIAALNKKEESA